MNWIRVEDRLPEDFDVVLTYGRHKERTGMFNATLKTWYLDGIVGLEIVLQEVTHWQPIMPPESEQETKNDGEYKAAN